MKDLILVVLLLCVCITRADIVPPRAATQAEVNAGVNTTAFVSPATFAGSSIVVSGVNTNSTLYGTNLFTFTGPNTLSGTTTAIAMNVGTLYATNATGNGNGLTNLSPTSINLTAIFFRGTNGVSGFLIPRCAVSNGVIYPYGTPSCTNLFESLSYTNGL